jgi:hypothetical protein
MILNEPYIDQYRQLHAVTRYGRSSEKLLPQLLPEVLELRPKTILDYGCGQSRLVDMLRYDDDVRTFRYDPAIAEIATLPIASADLVVNTDVMEHIPPDDVDDVLGHIAGISQQALFNIATAPAGRVLLNGDNAHCTVRPAEWWGRILARHFRCVEPLRSPRSTKCLFKTWKSSTLMWIPKKWWYVRESVKRRIQRPERAAA